MAIKAKYQFKQEDILRDTRPWTVRFIEYLQEPSTVMSVFVMAGMALVVTDVLPMDAGPTKDLAFIQDFGDAIFIFCLLYFWWIMTRDVSLPFRLPKSSNRIDPNLKLPNGKNGMADGILYLGNDNETGEEVWFTNSDARTHCLYLGTTGAGKTVGLKSYACNAYTWASGFIYIDGKADTDLWSTLSAQARRFGRDDDLLIMNYMTGNVTAGRVPSNTLNPFSSGSASYLTNMLVSLMPDSEGDNAMWKERAVALVSALMPCLVYKREKQNIPMSIGVIRTFLTFKAVIKLSRDTNIPDILRGPVKAYLDELPGYVDNVFDDNGDEKPAGGDVPAIDSSIPRQQHGYLSMQFTRSMQSLGDDYGFIFDTQAADIDIMDVVLNRRILVVLIPALEKSSDETANLGKIISTTLRGMMGATLGSTVEGDTATAIENKPTTSPTPFIAIFDEVGYYTAQGMAVMAAQARSLGFSLVFAGQDLPALEKRVKEEARSITANCNIKLFGKLEDPTQTKDFFEKTVGTAMVTQVSGYSKEGGGNSYASSQQASLQERARASYDSLRGFNEGRAICAFGRNVNEIQVYYSDIGHAKAMRVHRFLPIPLPAEEELETLRQVESILSRLRNPKWKPEDNKVAAGRDITALAKGFSMARKAQAGLVACGMVSVAAVAEAHKTINSETATRMAQDSVPVPASKEVEQAAAKLVKAETGSDPLNWGAIIGAGDAAEAVPPLRRDPPVTEQILQQAQQQQESHAPAQGGGMSWDNLMGAPETAAPAVAAPQSEDPAAEVVRAQAAGLAQPMSWGDIIGLSPAAPAVVAPAPAPVAPAVQESNTPAGVMSWGDIIGQDGGESGQG